MSTSFPESLTGRCSLSFLSPSPALVFSEASDTASQSDHPEQQPLHPSWCADTDCGVSNQPAHHDGESPASALPDASGPPVLYTTGKNTLSRHLRNCTATFAPSGFSQDLPQSWEGKEIKLVAAYLASVVFPGEVFVVLCVEAGRRN